ncbi:MerR family transcriptional regulator [Primorskyibacter flagellatus]|uniref:MerR HTH family regulatory protein n=1 Tax=Primorskyibacter flagellatus TaxID=1387277 RepID=A0A1W1YZJ8_9RHOB|nr:MerR family transcriptional regulator [Primorskyibacter flagellatus]SMC41556.1 MerR HTH family regulatory protein [Primorskyibacter flagellatus]
MSKSPDAFRTISEVAEWLETPAHVLRFWESKFTQVKPVKRAGGRRYYRPADMELIGGIKKLLHDDGMTIKGVQKMLREQGVRKVSQLSQAIDDAMEPEFEPAPFHEMAEAEGTVVPFGVRETPSHGASPPDTAAGLPSPVTESPNPGAQTPSAPVDIPTEMAGSQPVAREAPSPEPQMVAQTSAHAERTSGPHEDSPPLVAPEHRPDLPTDMKAAQRDEPLQETAIPADTADLPDFLTSPTFSDPGPEHAEPNLPPETPAPVAEEPKLADAPEDADHIEDVIPDPQHDPEPAPRAQIAEVAFVPQDAKIEARPGALTLLSRLHRLTLEDAVKINDVAERLREINDRSFNH